MAINISSQAPGVYVNEVAAGVQLIQGVGTSTPAFIAPIEGQGGLRLIRSWHEFEHAFIPAEGDGEESASMTSRALPSSFLPEVVLGYFANGGGPCYVVGVDASADDAVAAYQAVLDELACVSDVEIVVAPDMWASDHGTAIAKLLAGHCAQMGDRMALLHTPQGLDAQQAEALPAQFDLTDDEKKFATVYFPWVRVPGSDGGESRNVPPPGHVAGVWCRVDGMRGVHKSPANEAVQQVLGSERDISDDEQAPLNEVGVNCLRVFPRRGTLVWGARTLSQETDWRYLNVRRAVNYLQESIELGTSWAIFEPNNDKTWEIIRGSVANFLTDQWRRGALLGHTPDQAFWVVCDKSNNPPDSVAAGELVIDVGVAPLRPSEFINFRVTQVFGNI
ncbi:phage tail sheath C-terminal domain-containing protein [Nocardia sp. NPDC050710]|uniref:phage tail sheath family protein n=1 Tax=Nocardia sp. NPDC050710 TaxID=3157220 RepID=UPI0033FAB78D